MFGEHQGSLQSGMPGSNSEIWGRFCDGLGTNGILLVPLLLSWPNYFKGVRGQVG
jgi:hypothetical protein